jgi:hypothetical protein
MTSLEVILLHQDAPETGAVDQIKGCFFVWKKLQGGLFGMAYDFLCFLQSEINLPEQYGSEVHGPAQPADFSVLYQQRFFVYGHGWESNWRLVNFFVSR